MFEAALPGTMFFAAAAVAVILVAWRVRLWAQGRAAPVDVWLGLLVLPRRYLVHVHAVVARKHGLALMHALAAGGLVAAAILLVLVYGFGLRGIVTWLLSASLATALIGGCIAALRRVRAQPQLSRGAYQRLPWAILAFIMFQMSTALTIAAGTAPDWSHPLWMLLLVIGTWGTAELTFSIGFGPLRHAPLGALHLIAHPRPERFARSIDEGLRPLALDGTKLGVETAGDFAWNQLLAFDACVQCGRCETACPAFACGLPLNPKKLVHDLLAAESPRAVGRYTGSPHPGMAPGTSTSERAAIVGSEGIIRPETLWACTTCSACVSACPMFIEHVDAVIDLRRFEMMERGALAPAAARLIENLRETGNSSGRPPGARIDWATDLAIPHATTQSKFDVLLWLGDAAFDLRGQRTLRAVVRLLRTAGVSFATLGADERDCGHLARRLGDEAVFQDLCRQNLEALRQRRFQAILTTDPHALHTLRNEYIPFGGLFRVFHHTEFLLELMNDGRLAIPAVARRAVTYHDPCYLARYNDETASPRALIAKLGYELREPARTGKEAFCCGGGGGVPYASIPGRKQIANERAEQLVATRSELIAVACPGCTQMFEGVPRLGRPVVDIAELLADSLDGGGP